MLAAKKDEDPSFGNLDFRLFTLDSRNFGNLESKLFKLG